MIAAGQPEIQDGIEVTLFPDGDATGVAVRVIDSDRVYTHAVVRLFYERVLPGVRGGETTLTLSLVDVVPLIGADARSGTFFGVPLATVAFVRIELMQTYGQLDFFREPAR